MFIVLVLSLKLKPREMKGSLSLPRIRNIDQLI